MENPFLSSLELVKLEKLENLEKPKNYTDLLFNSIILVLYAPTQQQGLLALKVFLEAAELLEKETTIKEVFKKAENYIEGQNK